VSNILAYYPDVKIAAVKSFIVQVPQEDTCQKCFSLGQKYNQVNQSQNYGANTFNIMTLSITTLSIMPRSLMTLGIMTLSIMALSIMTLSKMTLSIMMLSAMTHNIK
jgi:hypothetical protein